MVKISRFTNFAFVSSSIFESFRTSDVESLYLLLLLIGLNNSLFINRRPDFFPRNKINVDSEND